MTGIQAGHRGPARSAHELTASESGEPAELVAPLPDSFMQQRALEALANVTRCVDDALGTLLATFA